jgi:hypothetical protein
MASIPTQEEVLAATRKGQEAMMAAIKTWLETVRTAAPKLPSTLQVSLPFADKLPTPQDAVANAYHLAEQLLASQRKFAEDLVKATAPLRAGYRQSSPEVPSRSAWQDAVTDSKPKTPAVSAAPKAVTSTEPKAVVSAAPKAVTSTEPKAVVSAAPKAVTSTEPQAADNTAPKAVPARPAVKSTPTRTAPRTAAAQRSTAGAASTTATSARKSATGSSARNSTTASSAGSARKSAGTTSPAPKDTDKS